jgi:hypothetical protein
MDVFEDGVCDVDDGGGAGCHGAAAGYQENYLGCAAYIRNIFVVTRQAAASLRQFQDENSQIILST